MSNADLLTTSGFLMLSATALLGFALAGIALWGVPFGPFRDQRQLMRIHIEWIMQAALAFGIAAVYPGAGLAPVVLFIVGGWIAPTPFLYKSIVPSADTRNSRLYTGLAVTGLTPLALSIFWLTAAWLSQD